MATYSSTPQNEIVTFTKSKNNPGSGNQPFDFDLVTVQDNEIYTPISMYASGDSGVAHFGVKGTLSSSYISGVSGLDVSGGTDINIIYWINAKYYSSSGIGNTGTDYLFNDNALSGINVAEHSFVHFRQIVESDSPEKDYRYYSGTTIKIFGHIHDYNVSNEVAAVKVAFLKTTFP